MLKAEIERLYNACGYTCAGLAAAWRHEGSFRAEVVAAAVLVPVAAFSARTLLEGALLIGSVLLVMIVELLNSSIESAVDRISLERHELSKRAKDTGSAAVALTVVLAVLIWGAILGPRLVAG